MSEENTKIVGKDWYTSKTLLANVLAIIGLVIGQISGNKIVSDPETVQYLALGLAFVNILLRFVTNKPIEVV